MSDTNDNLSPARRFLASLGSFVGDPKRRGTIDKHFTLEGNPTEPKSPGDPKRYPRARIPHKEVGGHDPLPTQKPHGARAGWQQDFPGKQTLITLLRAAVKHFNVKGVPSWVDMAGQTSNNDTRPRMEGMSDEEIQRIAERYFDDIGALVRDLAGYRSEGENFRVDDPAFVRVLGRHLKDKPSEPPTDEQPEPPKKEKPPREEQPEPPREEAPEPPKEEKPEPPKEEKPEPPKKEKPEPPKEEKPEPPKEEKPEPPREEAPEPPKEEKPEPPKEEAPPAEDIVVSGPDDVESILKQVEAAMQGMRDEVEGLQNIAPHHKKHALTYIDSDLKQLRNFVSKDLRNAFNESEAQEAAKWQDKTPEELMRGAVNRAVERLADLVESTTELNTTAKKWDKITSEANDTTLTEWLGTHDASSQAFEELAQINNELDEQAKRFGTGSQGAARIDDAKAILSEVTQSMESTMRRAITNRIEGHTFFDRRIKSGELTSGKELALSMTPQTTVTPHVLREAGTKARNILDEIKLLEDQASPERPKLTLIPGGGEGTGQAEKPVQINRENRMDLISPEARAELERRRSEAEGEKVISDAHNQIQFLNAKGKKAAQRLADEANAELQRFKGYKQGGVRAKQRAAKEAAKLVDLVDALPALMQGQPKSKKAVLDRVFDGVSEENVIRVLEDIKRDVAEMDELEALANQISNQGFDLSPEDQAQFDAITEEMPPAWEVTTAKQRLAEYERAARVDRINRKIANKELLPNDVDVATELQAFASMLSLHEQRAEVIEAKKIADEEMAAKFDLVKDFIIENLPKAKFLSDKERPNEWTMRDLQSIADGRIENLGAWAKASYTTEDRTKRSWGDLVQMFENWDSSKPPSNTPVSKVGEELRELFKGSAQLEQDRIKLNSAIQAVDPGDKIFRESPNPSSYRSVRLASGYQTDLTTGQRAYLQVVGGKDVVNKPLYRRPWNTVEELDQVLDTLNDFNTWPTTEQFKAAYRRKYNTEPPNLVNQDRKKWSTALASVGPSGRITFYQSFFQDKGAGKRHTFYHEIGHGLGDALTNDPEYFDQVTAPNFGKYFDATAGKDVLLSYVDIPDEHIADAYGTLLTGDEKVLNKILETFPDTVRTVIRGADKYGYPVPIQARQAVLNYFRENPNAGNAEYLDPRLASIPKAKKGESQEEVDDVYRSLLGFQDLSAWSARLTNNAPQKSGLATSEKEVLDAKIRSRDWASGGASLRENAEQLDRALDRLTELTGKSRRSIQTKIGTAAPRNSLYWGSLRYPEVRMNMAPEDYAVPLDESTVADVGEARDIPQPAGLTTAEQNALTMGLNDLTNEEWIAFLELSGADKAVVMAQLAQGVPMSEIVIP